jgi:hypothetical protein
MNLPAKIEDVADFLFAYVKEAEQASEEQRLEACLAAEQMNFERLAPDRYRKNLARLAVAHVALHLREENVCSTASRHNVTMALVRLRFETRDT